MIRRIHNVHETWFAGSDKPSRNDYWEVRNDPGSLLEDRISSEVYLEVGIDANNAALELLLIAKAEREASGGRKGGPAVTKLYSEALRTIAPHLVEHSDGIELLRCIAQHERTLDDPDPLGWDTAEALYWLSYVYHEGQWSALYAVGSVLVSDPLRYQPGMSARAVEPGTSAEMLYLDLVAIIGGDEDA